MKIIKIILKLLGGLVVLLGITGVVVINWDGITFQFNKIFWEPESKYLAGIYIGDTQSDVIFNRGSPTYTGEDTAEVPLFIYTKEYSSEQTLFYFENDIVTSIQQTAGNLNLPFSRVDQMRAILGEEDILAISKDYLSRRYTYLDWGVTYSFINNEVDQVHIGEVQWRQYFDGAEYIVKGRKICPSDDCPWDEEGELKPEYEEKDYRIFLSQ